MTRMNFTAADIPQDIAEKLQHLGQQADSGAWQVGRLTNLLIDDLYSEKVDFNTTSLYKAIASHVGCASETVRMRAYVARKFPGNLLESYPWLSFHQAKALVPFNEVASIDGLIQDWMKHSADMSIHVTSVDGLRSWLHASPWDPPPELKMYRRFITLLHRLADAPGTPGFVVQLLHALLKDLAHYSEKTPEWNPEGPQ